jgi:hypothetical protein
MRKTLISLLFGWAISVGASAPAVAENSTRVDGYTIHHNALTTDLLSPTIASAYQIRRSKSRAMLNVSVIKDEPDNAPGQSVSARVTAVAKNLLGQEREVPMREVREGTAVYYIGDFLVADRETLNFQLSVQPDGSSRIYQTSLSQEFFTK